MRTWGGQRVRRGRRGKSVSEDKAEEWDWDKGSTVKTALKSMVVCQSPLPNLPIVIDLPCIPVLPFLLHCLIPPIPTSTWGPLLLQRPPLISMNACVSLLCFSCLHMLCPPASFFLSDRPPNSVCHRVNAVYLLVLSSSCLVERWGCIMCVGDRLEKEEVGRVLSIHRKWKPPATLILHVFILLFSSFSN